MKRDPAALAAQTFDVIVIGAGIYGATLTLQLAEAGLRTLVIDQGDFCSATSANSLKILHGGLRYLQHGNIRRMRETIFSRRSLMRCAPHLTQPLACLIPTYGHGLRSRAVMRVASLPRLPVKAFAFPELTTTPRALPLFRLSRHHKTGAEQVFDCVSTPAATVPGSKRATIRSVRPL